MARDFDGSTGYLETSSPPSLTYPTTVSIWFYTNATEDARLWAWSDKNETGEYVSLEIDSSGSFIRGRITSASSNGIADTTTGYSTNTWHHACFVMASTISRTTYIDNGGADPNTDSQGLPTPTHMLIGGMGWGEGVISHFDGGLAECGIWSASLDDAERGALAAGASPMLVRPSSLICYIPVYGRVSPEIDRISNIDMTLNGTGPAFAHPRVINSAAPMIVADSGGAPPAGDPEGSLIGGKLIRGGLLGHGVLTR